MRRSRLDDELVRSTFERRARGFPAPRLFERILRMTGRAASGPVLVLVPEPVSTPPRVRRLALLVAAPMTVLVLAVLVVGQRAPVRIASPATSTSVAIVGHDEGWAADEDEAGDAAEGEADDAEDGTDAADAEDGTDAADAEDGTDAADAEDDD